MIKTQRIEGMAISTRMIEQLSTFQVSESGQAGANYRWAVGRHIANFGEFIDAKIIGQSQFYCFETAFLAGATLNTMDNVRVAMFAETPQFTLGIGIVNAAVIFSFVEQAKIIAAMEFITQIDVDEIIDRMTVVIEDIKLNKADSFAAADYQGFVGLSAMLIQHLAATRRVLPRIVKYQFPVTYPSLAMSTRIYGNGTRSEELITENRTIHPAFMQRRIIALSQ